MQKTHQLILIGALLVAVLVFSIFVFVSFNTEPEGKTGSLQVKWQQFLPGITGKQIIETSDEGFLILGTTATISNSSDTPNEHYFKNEQAILVKTDSQGNIQWQKAFQVENLIPTLTNIAQTRDGGYVVVGGITNSQFSRFCLIKLDSNGNVNWTQTYAGPTSILYPIAGPADATNDVFLSISETDNGGYVLFGRWNAAWDYHMVAHGYLVKTDAAGSKVLNASVSVGDASMVPASDGYIFFSTLRQSGGGNQFMLTKTNFNGDTLWSVGYRGNATSANEKCGTPTIDGGYLLGGYLGDPDKGWLIKTNGEGRMLWNRTYDKVSTINSVKQTQDGGFIIGGVINEDPDVVGLGSAWIARTDSAGNVQAQVTIGQNQANHYTTPNSVLQTSDGGYICVGTWNQTYQASSSQKFWIAKVDS